MFMLPPHALNLGSVSTSKNLKLPESLSASAGLQISHSIMSACGPSYYNSNPMPTDKYMMLKSHELDSKIAAGDTSCFRDRLQVYAEIDPIDTFWPHSNKKMESLI